MEESPSHNQLSDTQQIVLNIVPFPSAILSILGSTAIIYLAKQRRKVQQWTPYTRLLVAMSTCDILFSIMISTATFFRPKHTSDMMWAFGNDATCSFAAFMNQAATAGIWYQGMLSIYFWLTARYGMKNDRIANRIEPFMHLLALGYPIGTAIVGAVMGIYGERDDGPSCWIDMYSVQRGAADGGSTRVKDIQRDVLVYIFYAVPAVFVGLCLIYTQSSIYFFVRRYIRKSSSQDGGDEHTSCNGDVEVSLDSSGQSIPAMGSTESSVKSTGIIKTSSSRERNEDKQRRQRTKLRSQSQRLQLVCSQAFLFVMAFGLCQAFNLIMVALQSGAKTEADEMEMLVKYNHIAVMQKILLPIQGLFNFLIYVRPKYMMLRHKFPIEGRLVTMRRIFQGRHQLGPRAVSSYKSNANLEINRNQQHGAVNDRDAPVGDTKNLKSYSNPDRMARNMMSSITVGDGDFDSIADELLENGERWSDVSSSHVSQSTPSDLASGVNRLTSLEVISELSQSVFELTPYQVNGSHLSVVSDRVSIPSEPSESRWKGTETPVTSKASLGSSSTQDTGSELADGGPQRSRSLGIDSRPKAPMRNPVSPESPIRVLMRTVDTSSVSDVPIHVPIRQASDTSIDCAPMSPCPIGDTMNGSSDASPETKSHRSAGPKIGQSAKRIKASDMPLTLPERFHSQSPSEIEDV